MHLGSFLVKSFGNLGFYGMIILGEVSKSAFCHFISMVIVCLLEHDKDYEITCLVNPWSEELKVLLLCSIFASLC